MKDNETIQSGNLQRFLECYYQNLLKSRKDFPEEYAWSDSEMSVVWNRMVKAIKGGSFNKDSRSFRLTCKELGIKHTYKAIREFITL